MDLSLIDVLCVGGVFLEIFDAIAVNMSIVVDHVRIVRRDRVASYLCKGYVFLDVHQVPIRRVNVLETMYVTIGGIANLSQLGPFVIVKT